VKRGNQGGKKEKTFNGDKPKGNPPHTPPRELSLAVTNRKTPRNAFFITTQTQRGSLHASALNARAKNLFYFLYLLKYQVSSKTT